jgi:hypothetical protein
MPTLDHSPVIIKTLKNEKDKLVKHIIPCVV